ncbi:MAG: TlpA disulfide reductase family protein [Corynebacterium sp.]|nr:TlpA disulfide reductase family protein [Corynebacterium sp.]
MKATSRFLAAAMVLFLAGCSGEQTAGQDAVAIGGTWTFVSPGGKTEITYPAEERKPIQQFSGESLTEPSKTIALEDFKGKVVVVNAWGQWCAPCRSESDDLQEVHEALGDQGTVLGINVRDFQADAARDFIADNGITYPSIYDPPFKTAAAMGGVPASVIPTTIVLDKQHRPAAVFLREVSAKDLLEVTKPLLEEQ